MARAEAEGAVLKCRSHGPSLVAWSAILVIIPFAQSGLKAIGIASKQEGRPPLSSEDQVRAVADALGRPSETPEPALGLSLDGVINESPIFFKLLTRGWPGKVFVISSRHDRSGAEKMLAEYEKGREGIRPTETRPARTTGRGWRARRE